MHSSSRRLRVLVLLAALLPVALCMLLLGTGLGGAVDQQRADALRDVAKLQAERLRLAVEGTYRSADLLAGSPLLKPLREESSGEVEKRLGSAAWRTQVAAVFQSIAIAQRDYVQIRLIEGSSEGREIVRVDSADDGQAFRVPDDRLQPKGSRDYIAKARALAAAETYLSPLDLNRERGQIEVPYRPVMRVVRPLSNEGGEIRAFLVINLDFMRLLRRIYEHRTVGDDIVVVAESARFAVTILPESARTATVELAQDMSEDVNRALEWARTSDHSCYHRGTGSEAVHFERLALSPGSSETYLLVGIRAGASAGVASAIQGSWRTAILAVAGLTLVLGLLFFWFASRETRGLTRIAESARAVGRGAPLADLPLERTDEIGEVARALASMESALNAQRARLQATLDTAAIGLITADRTGAIRQINPAAEKMFGAEPGMLMGQNLRMIVGGEHRRFHDGYIQRYLNGGEPRIIGSPRVLQGEDLQGNSVPLELTVTALGEGADLCFVGCVRDLRKEKHLSKMIEELKRRNHELDEFAYATSHDLRAPLRSSVGLIDMGRQLLLEGDVEMARDEILPRIQTQLQRLDGLTSSIIQVTHSHQSVEPETEVEVEPLLASLRSQLEGGDRDFAPTRWKIHTTVASLITERDRLRRLLLNLVSNAVKFRDPEKTQHRVSIEVTALNATTVRFEISDNGTGFTENYPGEIFQMFTRGNARAWGTGLGMHLVRKELDRIGGEIQYVTNSHGTTFMVDVPTRELRRNVTTTTNSESESTS